MDHLTTQAVTVFLGFFAIMNPIANTASFAGLVGDRTKQEQRQIAIKAVRHYFFMFYFQLKIDYPFR